MEPIHPIDKKEADNQVNTKSTQVSIGLEPISFYKKDKNFVFAHQKLEKLISAVYLVTNFLSDSEPMKWSLRDLGTKLLRLNIDLKGGSGRSRESVELSVRDNVLEIVSLLEVGSFAGLVSEMNLTILKKEFHGLLTHISVMQSEQRSNDMALLESPFFAVPEQVQSSKISHIQRQTASDISSISIQAKSSEIIEKDIVQIKDINADTHEKSRRLKEFGPVAVKKNKRQSAIINLLKRKKEIMVKDVAELIHDCSEKTLQRELLSLVSQGIILKEGERRWTRYSLAE